MMMMMMMMIEPERLTPAKDTENRANPKKKNLDHHRYA